MPKVGLSGFPRNTTLRLAPVLVIIGLWLLFFWPMLIGESVAGYRDSSYLYYPIFRWIDLEIAAGNFPLWMPFDNSGFPLLADGTSSMLYPGKLVFHLRWLDFPTRYGIYLAMHVLLAALATRWFALTLGANRWGATVAGLSFAFGGSVLFQVCNVVYLVSAAWLPIALTCVWKMLTHWQSIPYRWAMGAGAACAMMILGGDPQMVYHCGLIALLSILCSAVFRRSASGPILRQCLALLMMVAVTCGLSAAQLLPTIIWAQQSDRASSTRPVNVWGALTSNRPIEAITNLIKTPDGPPVTDIYQFSQEPWTGVELVWSNIFGADAPINTRWTAAFPGAERVWTPSIYFGFIPLVFALTGIRIWSPTPLKRTQRRQSQVWLSWIAVLFGLGAMGWYGPVWLIKELGWGDLNNLHEASFGVYWLAVTALPKYFLFRYPAKLFVVAALALSTLAGIQFRPKVIVKCRYWWCAIGGLSAAGALLMVLPGTIGLLQRCQSTGLYGPFMAQPCRHILLVSFVKTMILSVCIFMIVKSIGLRAGSVPTVTARNRHAPKSKLRHGMLVIVALIAIDLLFSNLWMLHPIPATVMESQTTNDTIISQGRQAAQIEGSEILSIDRNQYEFNSNWSETSSTDRVEEIARWRRDNFFPKTHLGLANIQVHDSFCSIMPTPYQAVEQSGVDRLAKIAQHADGFLRSNDPIQSDNPMLTWNADAHPMAWVPESDIDWESAANQSGHCRVHWQNGMLVVQLPESQLESQVDGDSDAGNAAPQSRSIVIRLFAVAGWSAHTISDDGQYSSPVPIVAIDDLHHKITLHGQTMKNVNRIGLHYHPREFYIGVAISALSLLVCLSTIFLGRSNRPV